MNRRTSGVLAATLLWAGGAAAQMAENPVGGTAVRTTNDSDANSAKSQAVEQMALRILATEPMQRALADGLQVFGNSKEASKPDAMRYARSALQETGMFASLNAAMGVAPEPTFIWLYATPRSWHGYSMPGSRWYADNVDTMYRVLRVDERSSYEITVYPARTLPAQLSFMVYDWLMHNGMNPRNDVPLGTVTISEDTPRNADGSITLTLGPEPAAGRRNHVELKPTAKAVVVREIRGDWSPPMVRLAVKQTGGPAPLAKPLDALADEAAAYVRDGVNATVNISVGFGSMAENQLGELHVRWVEETGSKEQKLTSDEPLGPERALGFLSSFKFNLKEDEALVLTLSTTGTGYMGLNTYRPFLVTPEHVQATSSTNNYQAKANPDGTFTVVIARKDPGVYNWIDVSGIPYGFAGVRWQSLTKPTIGNLANAVRMQKVVKLKDLHQELPPTMVWVTPQERAQQRALRAEQFRLRCLGTPCEVGGKLDKP
jgi:hypothetical protein